MTSGRRSALVAMLVDVLRANGSWTGETHVQKGTYVLQHLLGVPTGFDFVLYKYGPFSFDLREHLTAMRGLGMLHLAPQPPPYGPKLETTEAAHQLEVRFPKTRRRYEEQVAFVGEQLGGLGVGALERVATALLVTEELGTNTSVKERAARLNEHKPHVSLASARASVMDLDRIRADAESMGVLLGQR